MRRLGNGGPCLLLELLLCPRKADTMLVFLELTLTWADGFFRARRGVKAMKNPSGLQSRWWPCPAELGDFAVHVLSSLRSWRALGL